MSESQISIEMNNKEARQIIDISQKVKSVRGMLYNTLHDVHKITNGMSKTYEELSKEEQEEMDKVVNNAKTEMRTIVNSMREARDKNENRKAKRERLDRMMKEIKESDTNQYDEKDSRKESNDK